MKKIVSYISVALLLAGCSLKENLQGYVTKENFYKTEEQCLSALRACYTPLHYIYNGQFMMATEACTDLWFCSSSDDNAKLAISPSNPGCAATVWSYAYKGVARANECVACISACPLDESVKSPMVAEARAMRALYYYVLTCFMGDVPFYTEAVSDIETMEHIRRLPRTPAKTIRSELYRDLKENALPCFTPENGLKCRANQVRNQHAGYALSLMLMAKFALWNGEWDDALYALDLIEETYGEFNEANFPLADVAWSVKETDESIYEIRHEWSETGVKFYGNVSSLMSPTCSGNGIYDGVYMDCLSRTGTQTTPLKVTKHYALFRSKDDVKEENVANAKGIYKAMPMYLTNETYNSAGKRRYCSAIDRDALESGVTANGSTLDRRIQWTIGMGNLETGETFVTLRKGGFFYGGPKFWCPDMTKNYDSNNYRIFRYADAVLMQAECHCMNGTPEAAVAYLDKVRARAGLEAYSFTDSEALMAEIRDERARELGGEFQRKFDLVRWGLWFDLTSQYNEDKRVKSNIRKCHEYYPIPDTECALSQGALNNDSYMD